MKVTLDDLIDWDWQRKHNALWDRCVAAARQRKISVMMPLLVEAMKMAYPTQQYGDWTMARNWSRSHIIGMLGISKEDAQTMVSEWWTL